MAIFCVRLQVELGWSIPDLGVFTAEWESPTSCIVAVKAKSRPDFDKVVGVVSVEDVTEEFAKEFLTPPIGGKFSWGS